MDAQSGQILQVCTCAIEFCSRTQLSSFRLSFKSYILFPIAGNKHYQRAFLFYIALKIMHYFPLNVFGLLDMAIYPKATSELNIFNDDVGDAKSPPDFMNTETEERNIVEIHYAPGFLF